MFKLPYHYVPWSGPLYPVKIDCYEPDFHKIPDKDAGQPFAMWIIAAKPAVPGLPPMIIVDIYFFRWRIFHKTFGI